MWKPRIKYYWSKPEIIIWYNCDERYQLLTTKVELPRQALRKKVNMKKMSDLSGYNSYNLLQQVPFQIGQSASVSFTKLELGAVSDFSTRPTKALLFSIVKIWRGLWRVYEIKKYLLCIYFYNRVSFFYSHYKTQYCLLQSQRFRHWNWGEDRFSSNPCTY